MTVPPLGISCHGITKSFGVGDATVHALRGVDLEIRLGEMMALVGPSGCGKTTLISILAGLLQRDEGDLSVLGSDPSEMSGHQRTVWRGANVGFIFQQFNLIPQVSIVENVAVPLALSVAVPSVVAPALNVTVPVGIVPPGTFATVAVRVAAEP